MRYPLDIFHNPIVLSSDPDTKYSPFLENATQFTYQKWPSRLLRNSISLIFLYPKYIFYAAPKKLSCPLSLIFSFLSPPPIDSSPFLLTISSRSSIFLLTYSLELLIYISNSLSFFCISSRRGRMN